MKLRSLIRKQKNQVLNYSSKYLFFVTLLLFLALADSSSASDSMEEDLMKLKEFLVDNENN